MSATASSIDPQEVEKFERLAAEWWDPAGKFRPLHVFNPVRLRYIREKVVTHFGCDSTAIQPFEGLRVLDIGCGGGLLSEPMARLGADVVGVDPAATNIEVARIHAEHSGLEIDYRIGTAEALAEAGEEFDVILNMEVVEHVAQVDAFIKSCASMVRRPDGSVKSINGKGGLMFVATINRTPKAYALAIVGAEYVLRWLPRGTHQYDKLVKPTEIESALDGTGLTVLDETGVRFDPFSGTWSQSKDMDVNYMILAGRT